MRSACIVYTVECESAKNNVKYEIYKCDVEIEENNVEFSYTVTAESNYLVTFDGFTLYYLNIRTNRVIARCKIDKATDAKLLPVPNTDTVVTFTEPVNTDGSLNSLVYLKLTTTRGLVDIQVDLEQYNERIYEIKVVKQLLCIRLKSMIVVKDLERASNSFEINIDMSGSPLCHICFTPNQDYVIVENSYMLKLFRVDDLAQLADICLYNKVKVIFASQTHVSIRIGKNLISYLIVDKSNSNHLSNFGELQSRFSEKYRQPFQVRESNNRNLKELIMFNDRNLKSSIETNQSNRYSK